MVVADSHRDVDPKVWTRGHLAVIKTAASDPEVERIFVNAAIKNSAVPRGRRRPRLAREGAAVVGARLPFPRPHPLPAPTVPAASRNRRPAGATAAARSCTPGSPRPCSTPSRRRRKPPKPGKPMSSLPPPAAPCWRHLTVKRRVPGPGVTGRCADRIAPQEARSAAHWAARPVSLSIGFQRAISPAMKARNSATSNDSGTSPSSRRRFSISGRLHQLHDLAIDLLGDVARQPGRRGEREPVGADEIGIAEFGKGRHLRIVGQPRLEGMGERQRGVAVDQARAGRYGLGGEVEMAADQIGQTLGGALVGHVLDGDAGLAAEIFRQQMAVAADAGGRKGQRAATRLAARDEITEASSPGSPGSPGRPPASPRDRRCG